MSTYLLVHGSWHGAWCLTKVVPLLRQRGHQVVAIDLAGHGADRTPAAQITLQTYVDQVCEAAVAQAEPVIAVGHSMAGIAITQAAERCPDAIQRLVYVTAYLPRDGESLLSLDQIDAQSPPPSHLVVHDDQGTVEIHEETVRERLYGDCTEEDARFAKERLVPDPIAPLATPVQVSPENFGRIPRTYIECLADRALSPADQRRMYEASPCDRVLSMDAGHAPFFSKPEELVQHLTAM